MIKRIRQAAFPWSDEVAAQLKADGETILHNCVAIEALGAKIESQHNAIVRLTQEKDRLIRIIGDAWAALRMIREAVEQQSVGALPPEEAVVGIGPTLLHEAAVIVEAVLGLTAERDAAFARVAELEAVLAEAKETAKCTK